MSVQVMEGPGLTVLEEAGSTASLTLDHAALDTTNAGW